MSTKVSEAPQKPINLLVMRALDAAAAQGRARAVNLCASPDIGPAPKVTHPAVLQSSDSVVQTPESKTAARVSAMRSRMANRTASGTVVYPEINFRVSVKPEDADIIGLFPKGFFAERHTNLELADILADVYAKAQKNGRTQRHVAAAIGMQSSPLARLLNLQRKLHPDLRVHMSTKANPSPEGKILSHEMAQTLITLSHEQQLVFWKAVVEGNLSVGGLRALIYRQTHAYEEE